MMKTIRTTLWAGLLATAFGGAAAAQSCETETAKADLSDQEAAELYDCIEAELIEGYAESGLEGAEAFRDWKRASTNTFVSATHGARFVHHYVNDVGEEAYLTYAEEGQTMPVGSITAKESFNVNDEGVVQPGPLFLMEKVEDGALPETDDWKYSLIFPNGKVQGVSGTDTGGNVQFCHGCHVNVLEGQDAMYYPEVDYRVN